MGFWNRLLPGRSGRRHEIRVVVHVSPFNFDGVDWISILEEPISTVKTKIPFNSGPTRISVETYDEKEHFTMDGRIPDMIHRFMRPNGVPLDFLIKEERIIQVNDNVKAYRDRS
jgi:hypothetical protein